MPAGDAGLERQPVDTAVIRRRLAEIGDLAADYGATIHVDGEMPLAEAVLHLAKSVPLLVNEVDRLRAQLAAMQAVVDAARQAVRGKMGGYVALREALRALDQAQAAQPEGEPR